MGAGSAGWRIEGGSGGAGALALVALVLAVLALVVHAVAVELIRTIKQNQWVSRCDPGELNGSELNGLGGMPGTPRVLEGCSADARSAGHAMPASSIDRPPTPPRGGHRGQAEQAGGAANTSRGSCARDFENQRRSSLPGGAEKSLSLAWGCG